MIQFLSKVPAAKLRGTALLRLDFNTEDDWRMEAAVPTVQFLLKRADKVVIVSHRGRPTPVPYSLIRENKRIVGIDKRLSLQRDALRLEKLLKRPVYFVPHFDFAKIKKEIAAARAGSVFVLENLRFIKGEEKDDSVFARQLASLADFYVNDAFAVSHRANASVHAITKFLPSYAGLIMEKEIKFLGQALARPMRPLVFLLGGAKAADKLGVIKYFKRRADWFILGGGPANTILWLKGMDVKNSLRDKDSSDLKELKRIADFKKIVLPVDFKWYKGSIVDFDGATIKSFTEKIGFARMIIWSGPFGLISKKSYERGTLLLARAIAKNQKAFSIAGGGETVMFLKKHHLDKKFSFISTGGGAMVDFLAGKELPGIKALENSK